MKKVIFKTNINCGSCIKKVTPTLNSLDNIDEWKVDTNHADKLLEVTIDDENIEGIIKAIQEIGFNIIPI